MQRPDARWSGTGGEGSASDEPHAARDPERSGGRARDQQGGEGSASDEPHAARDPERSGGRARDQQGGEGSASDEPHAARDPERSGGRARHQHWFEPIAAHLGSAYLRYSFTKGTVQEVDHVVGALSLQPGQRVLDVGCGPGRHAHELARRGIEVHGIDISREFIELACRDAPNDCASFERLDARDLSYEAEFDAVICLCQGAFGSMTAGDDDERVVAAMARALRPGGRLALSAFNAYFAVKYHEAATFDAELGVAHERTEVRNPAGEAKEVDLWTGCYTPRELRLILAAHGLHVDRLSSVEPGAYGDDPPSTESPEFLVVATKSA